MTQLKDLYVGRTLFIDKKDVYIDNVNSEYFNKLQYEWEISEICEHYSEDNILVIKFLRPRSSTIEIFYCTSLNQFLNKRFSKTDVYFDRGIFEREMAKKEIEVLKRTIENNHLSTLECWNKIRLLNAQII